MKVEKDKISGNFILIGLGFGLIFWIAESLIHVFLFQENTLSEQLFSPALHEIWMRLVVVALFVIISIYAQLIINQRKRAYGELNQVFNTAADGMRIIDKDFNVLKANETFLNMLGMTWEEMAGKKCYEVFSGPSCHTSTCSLRMIMAGEKRVESDIIKQCPNGRTIPCIVTATPFKPGNTLAGTVEDFKDISHLKQIEDTLRRSEEKHRSVLEASPDPIVVYNMNGEVEYLNPAFTRNFGWTLAELKGKTTNYVPPEYQRETRKIIEKVLNGESIYAVDSRRYTKKGHLLDVRISVAVYTDQNGRPEGSVHILRDITERKRFQAHLQQMQKMESIGTLAGGIAHDFNNLLMGIQGNVSLILFDMDPASPQYTRLKKIEKQVESGAKLTTHLLGYARKGKYEVNPLDLNNLVRDVCENFIRGKGVKVDYDLVENLPAIEADKGQIEQVIINLFINAVDAMPNGGNLLLKTTTVRENEMVGRMYSPDPGEYVMLAVTDTGVGMDTKTLERIFEPFFTTKGMGVGTGLGLASAYGIIKNHHGYIDVETTKGEGTTFKIFLPASEKKIGKKANKKEEIVKGSETVLLVDDEDMIIDVNSKMLESIGYSVMTARSGRQAIETYRTHLADIDIVVLDMIMEDMKGDVVYAKLKEINPDVKVLLSSGYSIDGLASGILKNGCNGFIQKPFSLSNLSKKIREIVSIDQPDNMSGMAMKDTPSSHPTNPLS